MHESPPRLTHHGILYLSLGFKQDYLLQVLTHRQHQSTLQMVLYDGLTYIGAHYSPSTQTQQAQMNGSFNSRPSEEQSLVVSQYDVVRIFPMDVRPNQPIEVQSLVVIRRGLTELLGREAITLEQFMRRRAFQRPIIQNIQNDEEMSPHTRKITKLFEEASFQKENTHSTLGLKAENLCIQAHQNHESEPIIIEDSFPLMEEREENSKEMQRMISQNENHSVLAQNQDLIEKENQQEAIQDQQMIREHPQREIQQATTQKNQLQIQPQLQEQPQKTSNIIIDIQDDDANDFTLNNKNPIPPFTNAPPASQKLKPQKISKSQQTQHIRDLYQRMHRFRILCRINHISHFTSQRGVFCIKLILIDELGDQIICMIFQKSPPSQQKNNLIKGKSYIFQNGEVIQEEGCLSISIPFSGIIQNHRFLPSFVPSKMQRLGSVEKQQDSKTLLNKAFIILQPDNLVSNKKKTPINVCGIFQGFKEQPRLTKNLFRVVGILCDPDLELAIHFFILVDQLKSFPEAGTVVSLHNVQVVQEDQILILQGTKMAYILSQTGNIHPYFSDLLQSSTSNDWKLHQYRNLSQITYVPRTINDLQHLLLQATEQSFFYSQIDCRIANIKEKKCYPACVTCKRQVKAESSQFSYCFNCKKINKYFKKFIFQIELSDTTGSLTAYLSNVNLKQFIGFEGEQYASFGKDDRNYYLDLVVFKGLQVKLKSQRVVGAIKHKAISAAESSHKRSLSQIRAISIEQKTKYVNQW